MVGTLWPMAPMVWWLLWQCMAQSPGSSASQFDLAHLAHGHVGGHFGPARAFGHGAAVGAGDFKLVPVDMHGVVGHGEVAHADAHALAQPPPAGSMAGNTRLFQHQMLKSSMVLTLGVMLPGSTSKALSRKQ
jgi:hypothetical protein